MNSLSPVSETSRWLYRVPVAAEALGISRSSLYLLIQNGELETVTVGRRRLVPADAITDYVDRLRQVEGVTPSSEAAK